MANYPQAVSGAMTNTGALSTFRTRLVGGVFASAGQLGRGTAKPVAGALSQALTIGLVAYWPLSETSGTREDVAGNDYDLTDVGSVPATTGLVYGQAASFDMSTDQWLARTRASAALINFGPTDAFTMAAWVYPTAFSGGVYPTAFSGGPDYPTYYRTIFNFNAGDYNSGGYLVMLSDGQVYCRLGATGGVTHWFQWHTLQWCALNTWQLVIFAYDGPSGAATMRLNTTERTTTNTNAAWFRAASKNNFSIGAQETFSRDVFDGRIGPAMMWNRVLSSAEMTDLYASSAGWAYLPPYPGGSIVRATATGKSGAWSGAGTTAKRTAKAFAGAWSGAGTVMRVSAKVLAGAWSGAGTVMRVSAKVLAGAWSGAGAIARAVGKAASGAWSGSGRTLPAIPVGYITTTEAGPSITTTLSGDEL